LALGNLVVLDGVLQHHDAALRARDSAANGDQVELSVNLDNVQVLNSDLLSAQVARHHFALHDLGRIRAGAHRTLVTVHRAGAVAHRGTASVEALDDARVAL